MLGLTALVLLCGGVSAGSHSLRYFFTSMTPIPGLPQFVIVGYVDDVEFVLYDSNRKEMIPRQCWMAESEGPEYWKQQTQTAQEWEQALTISIQNLMRRTNQTDGTHTYQLMYGCEMRDDGSTSGFEQFGWDGKDYVNFDKDHVVWVTRANWGEVSKNKWDQTPGFNQHVKRYLEQECIQSLKKYLKDGEQELRPFAPQVFLSANKAPATKWTQLSCLVTGFYPCDIEVILLRNGKPIMGTYSTGILPNHNGTCQLRRWAQIELSDRAIYSCTYEHSNIGVETRNWDGTFRLTPGSSNRRNHNLTVGVITIIPLISLVIVMAVWKRRAVERGESSPNISAPA